MVVETIGIGELLGCSWLFPPYRWGFGAVTISPFEAFEFDTAGVRACCAADPVLGASSHCGSPRFSPADCRPP
jgi:hypothetical protein